MLVNIVVVAVTAVLLTVRQGDSSTTSPLILTSSSLLHRPHGGLVSRSAKKVSRKYGGVGEGKVPAAAGEGGTWLRQVTQSSKAGG